MKKRVSRWQYLSLLLSRFMGLFGLGTMAILSFMAVYRRRVHHNNAARVYKDTIDNKMNEPMTLHPEIDPLRCAGCAACVRACPEGEIIQIIDHRAVLVEPTLCVGHGQCEVACPFSAITLVFGTKTRGMELPRVSGDFETNVPGLYIAGELGGMGLIRNAIKQGRMASDHAVSKIQASSPRADVDVLVVGAGAAGLSATLAAIKNKRSYLCIEQGSVGGTIYNFPRQKIVMTQPAELPLVGVMRFPKHKVSKEELLEYWTNIRKATGLVVKENCKFISLKKAENGIFAVETSRGQFSARKVILAMGVRGSPRKLGLANEGLPKVTYNLLDPEQYQGMHVAVVGGGNAAVEAAQYLGRPEYRNKVSLIVRGPIFDRCNAENQAIIRSMAEKGLVNIIFNSSVKEIHEDRIVIDASGKTGPIKNDFLFIFIGAELPFTFLQSLGIKIEKKFGEPVKKASV